MRLDWPELFNVNVDCSDKTELNKILNQYKDAFSPGLGKLRNMKLEFELKANVSPQYCKARPVPYALKTKVESELDRLVFEGVLKPVEFSM